MVRVRAEIRRGKFRGLDSMHVLPQEIYDIMFHLRIYPQIASTVHIRFMLYPRKNHFFFFSSLSR